MGSAQKYSVLLTGRVGAATRRVVLGGGVNSQTEKDAAGARETDRKKVLEKNSHGPVQDSVLDRKSLVEAGVRSRCCGCEGVSDRGDTSSLIKCETI